MPSILCHGFKTTIILTLHGKVKISTRAVFIKLKLLDSLGRPIHTIVTEWANTNDQYIVFDPSSPYILSRRIQQAYMVREDNMIIALPNIYATNFHQARLYGNYIYYETWKYIFDGIKCKFTNIDNLFGTFTDKGYVASHVVIVKGKEVVLYVHEIGKNLLAFSPDLEICALTEYMGGAFQMEIIDNTFIWSKSNDQIVLGNDLILENKGRLQDVVGNYFSLEHENGISVYFVKNQTYRPLHNLVNLQHSCLVGLPNNEGSAFILNYDTGALDPIEDPAAMQIAYV